MYMLLFFIFMGKVEYPTCTFASLLKTVGGGIRKGEGGKYFKKHFLRQFARKPSQYELFFYSSKDPFNLPIFVKIVSIQSPYFQNSTPHGSIK